MEKETKSKAELEATENYEKQKESLIQRGYTERVMTISVLRANVMALILALPFIAIFQIIYVQIWNAGWESVSFLILGLVLLSIPIHELLHGIGWSIFCKDRFKGVRFGLMRPSFTPYCSCKEPLTFFQYLTGAALPLLVLGILPSILGVVWGNHNLLVFGMFGFITSGGDMAICLNMFKLRTAVFLDHPTECGFIAFLPE